MNVLVESSGSVETLVWKFFQSSEVMKRYCSTLEVYKAEMSVLCSLRYEPTDRSAVEPAKFPTSGTIKLSFSNCCKVRKFSSVAMKLRCCPFSSVSIISSSYVGRSRGPAERG